MDLRWHRTRQAAGDQSRGALERTRGERVEASPMTTIDVNERQMRAPEVLGLEARGTFRDAAVQLLDELPESAGRLIVDFAGTRRIDSAGLGALMLVQRKAGERQQRVVLRNLRDEFRFLLVLTKLDDLFEIEAPSR